MINENSTLNARHVSDDFEKKYGDLEEHGETVTGNSVLLETYGEELEKVRQINATRPNHLWTIIDEGGELFIAAGFRVVNRFNYVTTAIPWVSENEVYKW